MIGKLTGILDEVGEDYCVVDVHGVGYVAYCSSRTLGALPTAGAAVTLFIETYVREDMIRLYGFESAEVIGDPEVDGHQLFADLSGTVLAQPDREVATKQIQFVRNWLAGGELAQRRVPEIDAHRSSRISDFLHFTPIDRDAPTFAYLSSPGSGGAAGTCPRCILR